MLPMIKLFNGYVSSYLIAIIAGAVLAYLLFILFTSKKSGIDTFNANMLFIISLLGAFLGSKLLYIIVELDSVIKNGLWGYISGGGFVFYGGLIGGAAAAYLYCRKNDIGFAGFADSAVSPICLAHAIGRLGCFMVGCCYGCETTSPLGVIYPEGCAAPAGVPLLPTQLMESGFLLMLFVVLLIVFIKGRKLLPSAVYLITYGAWRFIIEYFRSDPRGSLAGLSTSQIISIFAILIGTIMLYKTIKKTED